MSEFVEPIPLAEVPQNTSAPKPEVKSAQPDLLGIAVEAAQIANIKDASVRTVAAQALGQEFSRALNWEKPIQDVARALQPYEQLPVVSCGKPLADKDDEGLAQSLVQVTEIQDPRVIKEVQDTLVRALRTGQQGAETNPALKEKLAALETAFKKRLSALKKCNPGNDTKSVESEQR